ncbi:MAG TPA: hypothetical protein VKF61_01400 [Candidatus Polarisedimenticolia bacterium]|nr:hypothetical protein [Candidatus Polarisedimenticolia bacterium]
MRKMRGAFVAALLALLAAPGCGARKGAAGMVRSSVLGTYPQETAALLVVEIKKIRALRPDTPWIKDMAALADRQDGPFREIIGRLGPELMGRLERLSLAVVPQADSSVGYAILAEGSFDAAKLREALGGSDSLTLVETGETDFSAALLQDTNLALGPKSVLDRMRENAASRGHGLDGNAAILSPLERVRPEAQLWGALDCRSLQRLFKARPAASSDFGKMPLDSPIVQSLVSIAFRGMIGDSVDLDLYGRADAETNAKTLAEAARGLVALGRVGAGRDQAKEWFDFLDGIRIEQRGAEISLRASIPSKTMESLVGQMKASSQPPAPEPPHEPAQASTMPAPSTPKSPPRPPAGSAPPAGSSGRTAPAPRGTQTPGAAGP